MANKRIGTAPAPCCYVPAISSLSRWYSFAHLLLWSAAALSPASSQSAAGAGEVADRRALLRMKEAWGNPPSLSSWNGSSYPCAARWNGIDCREDGSVRSISLVHQGIKGEVPAATCDLRNLTSLDLFNNSIGGGFPTALYKCSGLRSLNLSQNLLVGALPADIDRLSKLEFLVLSYNNFSGDVPIAISRIPGLRQLSLEWNLLNGTFPKELGTLKNLEQLSLGGNPFKPMAIPAELGNLGSLKYLWLGDNNLTGDIPDSLSNLFLLEHLDLSSNQLMGAIPEGIWKLQKLQALYLYNNKLSGRIATAGTISITNLVQIDLSTNQLSGPIPEEIGKQPNLGVLFLYRNLLSGPIPDSLASMSNLTDIRLFDNGLTGVLPAGLGKNSKLLNLEVSNNRLHGQLPGDLCAGGALNSLILFNNSFAGSLPKSLGSCKSLENLQVYDNNFSGDFPAEIWTLPNLLTLLLHGNSFSGELPRTLSPSLSRLEMENNRFSGKLPLSAPGLKVFKGSNNMFSGEVPADLTGVSQIQMLLLDMNQISGVIPAGIRALQWLVSLNLRANLLSGSIPVEIGSLPMLTSIDLSANHLTGEIPAAMGSLRLNSLNLSSNSLTGQIPSRLDIPAYGDSFLSNPGLCSPKSLRYLPTCVGTSTSRSDGLSKGLITVFWVVGALFLIAALYLAVFVVRDLRRRKYGYEASSWKLTSFQSVDFAEANIIRGIIPENLVGAGGSGQVYRVVLGNRSREIVAVKKIWNSRKLNSNLEKEFEAEVKILGSIRHDNIVKLLCCISSPDSKFLVYEYMENGSLDQWLHGDNKDKTPAQDGFLDWPTRLSIAVGAAQGLCYMHHHNSPAIVHRDVKSSNILLDADFKPKVADFGLARVLSKSGEPETVSAIAGSFGYMAPECAHARKVNEKVDVYSFGVVLLELTTGRRANDGGDGEGSLADWAWRKFQEGNSIASALDDQIINPLYMDEMTTVLRLGVICTGSLPSTRPTMKEVLQVLLRCAQAHEEVVGKAMQAYDATPLLGETLKKGGSRNSASYCADDGEDEGCRLSIRV